MKSSINRRRATNNRLNRAGYLWAFSALRDSPGARTHYWQRRDEHGDWHAAAQRNLFNRTLDILLFEEATAVPTVLATAA